MKRNFKKRLLSLLLSVSVFMGMVAVLTEQPEVAYAREYEDAGYEVAVKGQPIVFQDKAAKKLKVLSAGGNKYKVNGNIVTVYCKKSCDVKYKIGKKYKNLQIELVSDIRKEKEKITKKEYDCPKFTVGKKSYTNFIDAVRNEDSNKTSSARYIYEGKKKVNSLKKYNRGVTYGFEGDLPYKDIIDGGEWDGEYAFWAAVYYDKESGFVFNKVFVYKEMNYGHKLYKVVYYAYNPLHKSYIRQAY